MKINDWIDLMELDGKPLRWDEDDLTNGSRHVPVENGIPRLTPDASYSEGNFAKLREKHATLQLDSVNGTTDRRDTILERTQWSSDFFKGKLVLECGCGAGPDTEVLLNFGAKVVSVDLAGVDVAKANLGNHNNSFLIQADIADLPLKKQKFDVVFCHRVIQHTPDPEKTLEHILGFVKPGGSVFVHSYARTFIQMFRWKYFLRPFTKRMDPGRLYNAISWYAPFTFKLTNFIDKLPGGFYFDYFFIPFLNKRGLAKFTNLTDEQILEYSVHDTFDALAPRYDKPISSRKMEQIAKRHLDRPFHIEKRNTITLLRTLP